MISPRIAADLGILQGFLGAAGDGRNRPLASGTSVGRPTAAGLASTLAPRVRSDQCPRSLHGALPTALDIA